MFHLHHRNACDQMFMYLHLHKLQTSGNNRPSTWQYNRPATNGLFWLGHCLLSLLTYPYKPLPITSSTEDFLSVALIENGIPSAVSAYCWNESTTKNKKISHQLPQHSQLTQAEFCRQKLAVLSIWEQQPLISTEYFPTDRLLFLFIRFPACPCCKRALGKI